MKRIFAGIDEAGLGPLLGPLSAARAVGTLSPQELEAGLAAAGLLQGKESQKTTGLESKQRYRGVRKLAKLEHLALSLWLYQQGSCIQGSCIQGLQGKSGLCATAIFSQAEIQALGVLPWYQGLHSLRLPLEASDEQLSRSLASWQQLGEPVELEGRLYTEAEFNRSCEALNNKGLVLQSLLSPLLQALPTALVTAFGTTARKTVYCTVDRLGGRKFYQTWLSSLFSNCQIIAESSTSSHYLCLQEDTVLSIAFEVKADAKNAYCSLASCWAKYRREVLMWLFNEYWQQYASARGFELSKTSGYWQDAKLFLSQLRSLPQEQKHSGFEGAACTDLLRQR